MSNVMSTNPREGTTLPNWQTMLTHAGVNDQEFYKFESVGLQYGLADLLYRHSDKAANIRSGKFYEFAAELYDDFQNSLERYGTQPAQFSPEEVEYVTESDRLHRIAQLQQVFEPLVLVEIVDDSIQRTVDLALEANQKRVRGADLGLYVDSIVDTLGNTAHAIDPDTELLASPVQGE